MRMQETDNGFAINKDGKVTERLKLRVEKHTLTDRSEVFSVVLESSAGNVRIDCMDQQQANTLYRELRGSAQIEFHTFA